MHQMFEKRSTFLAPTHMATRELLSGPVTLSDAKERSSNLIQQLQFPHLRHRFFTHLESQRYLIRELVAHHLGANLADCTISPRQYWLHGSFNVCIPATVSTKTLTTYVIVRLPLPYRVGEVTHPGNADEKLRSEAATYIWLQENCPSVPIPRLYGLGLSTGQQFTDLQYLPWWSRWLYMLRHSFRTLLGHSRPTRYVSHKSKKSFTSLSAGYLIIETIEEGNLLSHSWDEKHTNERLRKNLNRGIAQILLALTAIPLPRIGSFRLGDDGCLRLENRPLSVEFVMHENEDIPLDMPRQLTFSRVDEFVLQHLAAFDSRLSHQPNPIKDDDDGYFQMAGLAAARALFPYVFRTDLRHGPFAFTLTDLHKSNIIVDDEWNIVSLIDLEFACSWPLEFQQPPFWLGGQYLQDIDQDAFLQYTDFVQVLEEQEASLEVSNVERLSSVMRKTWASGAFWVFLAIQSPVSFTSVLFDRLIPYHLGYTMDEIKVADYHFLARLWCPDSHRFVERKVQDYEDYQNELDTIFSDNKKLSDP